jgi:succinyl-diaminopimelate desuccinylase
MENILRQLIAFPSITGEDAPTRAVLEHMTIFFAERGLYIAQYECEGSPSFVATTKPDEMSPEVMLVAHIDVVPAPADQFRLTKKDGRYYGRGVFDMKFAAAAYMQLIDDLHQAGQLQEYDLGIMITADEEAGGKDGVGYLVEEGYRAGVCVVPDGGEDWRIETFAKGAHWIELSARGVAAHASRPWEGEHANHKLLAALHDIRKLFPHNDNREGTILSVGTIEGGQAPNQTAVTAKAVLDVRYATDEAYSESLSRIQEVCRVHHVQATLLAGGPPMTNELTNPYIASFYHIMCRVVDHATEPSRAYAATDGRYFGAHGIPCVIVEPPGGGRHSENEWISVEGCQQFLTVLSEFVEIKARQKDTITHSKIAVL